jgi:hypothetical protein
MAAQVIMAKKTDSVSRSAQIDMLTDALLEKL